MMRSKKQLWITLMSIALGAATTSATEKPDPQPVSGKIKWVFDYEEGKKLSRDTGKPMFVVFRCER